MRLSNIQYYTDFFIYPVLIMTATAWMLFQGSRREVLYWICAVLAGLVLWTFLEYAIHRLVLHRIAVFAAMHATHHDAPGAKIGTPSWITLAILLTGICFPSCLALGLVLGNGITVGTMTGFFWYICVHHAIHNRKTAPGTYLNAVKRHHARHHHANSSGISVSPRRFGITCCNRQCQAKADDPSCVRDSGTAAFVRPWEPDDGGGMKPPAGH